MNDLGKVFVAVRKSDGCEFADASTVRATYEGARDAADEWDKLCPTVAQRYPLVRIVAARLMEVEK